MREIFLYACAHCQSAERLAYILKNLRPRLGKADFVDALGYSPFFYAAFTATRARLLLLCRRNETFAGLPFRNAKGKIPIGFLDSISGRQWTCENNRPGCAYVRCSEPTLFTNVLPHDELGIPCARMAKLHPALRRAIDADPPSRFAMTLSLLGRRVDTRLVVILLELRPVKILEWLLENDAKTQTLLNHRRMLFYVCANWPGQAAVEWLEKAEAREPGILKSCVDPLGRNLLWYFLYNWGAYSEDLETNRKHESAIVDTLLKHGCDPDAETVWGLNWRDMKAVR